MSELTDDGRFLAGQDAAYARLAAGWGISQGGTVRVRLCRGGRPIRGTSVVAAVGDDPQWDADDLAAAGVDEVGVDDRIGEIADVARGTEQALVRRGEVDVWVLEALLRFA